MWSHGFTRYAPEKRLLVSTVTLAQKCTSKLITHKKNIYTPKWCVCNMKEIPFPMGFRDFLSKQKYGPTEGWTAWQTSEQWTNTRHFFILRQNKKVIKQMVSKIKCVQRKETGKALQKKFTKLIKLWDLSRLKTLSSPNLPLSSKPRIAVAILDL